MITKARTAFILSCLVLLTSDVFLYQRILSTKNDKNSSTKDFPYRIGNWIGEEVHHDKGVVKELSPDSMIYRRYGTSGTPIILLPIFSPTPITVASISMPDATTGWIFGPPLFVLLPEASCGKCLWRTTVPA